MKPTVKNGALWTEEQEIALSPPVLLDSPEWNEWLISHRQFQFHGTTGHFSARRESRHGSDYWYAYRRRDGTLHKAYLGKVTDLTLGRLEEVAASLDGRMVLSQLSLTTDAPGIGVSKAGAPPPPSPPGPSCAPHPAAHARHPPPPDAPDQHPGDVHLRPRRLWQEHHAQRLAAGVRHARGLGSAR